MGVGATKLRRRFDVEDWRCDQVFNYTGLRQSLRGDQFVRLRQRFFRFVRFVRFVRFFHGFLDSRLDVDDGRKLKLRFRVIKTLVVDAQPVVVTVAVVFTI
jgi:hypothetical protein